MEALQYAYDVLAKDGHLTAFRVQNTSQQKLAGAAPGNKIAPDLVLQVEESKADHWTRALAIVEVKPYDNQDPFRQDEDGLDLTLKDMKTWDKLQDYGTIAFQTLPRCYLLGFGVYGNILRFWRWDRSSVIFTSAFKYKEQSEPLLQFLYASSAFSHGSIGTDTTVVPRISNVAEKAVLGLSYDLARDTGVLQKKTRLLPDELAYESAVIVVPAGHVDASEINDILLASAGDSAGSAAVWTADDKALEQLDSAEAAIIFASSQTDARGHHPQDDPLVTVGGDSFSGGESPMAPDNATTEASEGETSERYISVGPALFTSRSLFGRGTRTWLAVRVSSPDSGRQRVEMTDLVVIKDSWRDEDRFPESAIYAKVHEAGPVFGVARARRGVDLDQGEQNSVHRTWAQRLNNFYDQDQYSPRIHQCIVLQSIGIPLSQFRSTCELVEATRDAMKGHQHLFEKLQILHRDISVNNIMISVDPKAEGGAKGFIIDLEYAAFFQDRRPASTLREITGTIYFMAIERLDEDYQGEHKSHHDLESFYWSLLYTTLCHTITNRAIRDCESIFGSQDAAGKVIFLLRRRSTLTVLNNPRLSACLHSFGGLVWESFQSKSAVQYITHRSAINSLDEELEKPGWRENDKALPIASSEAPGKEEIGRDRKCLPAVGRLMNKADSAHTARQAAVKRKARDAAGDGQNDEVKTGESSSSKRSRQRRG
ncbi:hypothetical protein OE88DRAFT_1294286 [Heliocybe sulcata]|uniref:Fungal-type protein kinase domain-containing protein n=1 Tax=Heliocybe sulcata TaxID=5364 RepID=A0A5C3N6R0_9AGAM|nr:hypothetical protein OE88DRAFT_1294286 [Heliocybe sulcata]